MNTDTEIALKWFPVSDFPHAPCQHWRVRSDSDFRLTAEGDFFVGPALQTLIVEFRRVHAFAAHDDMGGISMFGADVEIPMIGGEVNACWPMLKIQNSKWIAAARASPEENSHFSLLSYECTVEVIAGEPEVRWKWATIARTIAAAARKGQRRACYLTLLFSFRSLRGKENGHDRPCERHRRLPR